MSVPVVLRRIARREFDEAADRYEAQRPGLGARFVDAVNEVLSQVADNPERYAEVLDGVKEGLVRGFPFAVYYRPEETQIVVLAVFHSSRDPAIWQART